MATDEHVDLGTVRKWLEDELSPSEERRVAAHLESCRACKRFVDDVRDEETVHDLTIGLAAKQEGLVCYGEEELRAYWRKELSDEEAENVRIHLEDPPCERCSAVLDELKGESSFSQQDRDNLRERLMRETKHGR